MRNYCDLNQKIYSNFVVFILWCKKSKFFVAGKKKMYSIQGIYMKNIDKGMSGSSLVGKRLYHISGGLARAIFEH